MPRHLRLVVLLVGFFILAGSPVHAALIANVSAGSANGLSITSAEIDTSGANFLVLAVAYDVATSPTISDSKSNTWTARTIYGTTSNVQLRIYYVANPTVGTNHTFTASSGSATYPAIAVQAHSGRATVTPYDVENGAVSDTNVSTLSTGSVTPSENNELIIAARGSGSAIVSGVTINASLTITDTVVGVGGQHYGMSLAYFEQGTAAAINPAWSWTTASSAVASIATFKAAAASGPPVGSRMLLGVGR